MPDIIFHGSRAELYARLAQLGPTLAGRVPDPTGLVPDMLTQVGLSVLGNVQDDFVRKSEGGVGEVGGRWPALAATTLALRRRGTGKGGLKDTYERLQREFANLSQERKNLILQHYGKLSQLYTATEERGMTLSEGARARRHARFILEKMRPFIAQGRYTKLKRELAKPFPAKKAEQTAFVGAFALILRDTGRLLNSLSPKISSPDRKLRVISGAVTIGSNVKTKSGLNLLELHTSGAPRKQKRDGSGPRLPRRQVLPDKDSPMPKRWVDEAKKTLTDGLKTFNFWQRFLGAR